MCDKLLLPMHSAAIKVFLNDGDEDADFVIQVKCRCVPAMPDPVIYDIHLLKLYRLPNIILCLLLFSSYVCITVGQNQHCAKTDEHATPA